LPNFGQTERPVYSKVTALEPEKQDSETTERDLGRFGAILRESVACGPVHPADIACYDTGAKRSGTQREKSIAGASDHG